MYLYSLTNHRIEHQVGLEDEQFISMKIDPYGFFFETQSFKTPRNIYRINFDQLRPQQTTQVSIVNPVLWKESRIPNLNVAKLKVLHDSFHICDQIKIPITIIQKPNAARNRPCLVFAYGGYGIPMLPLYKLFFLLFIELFNGVVGSYPIKIISNSTH